jgi:hypothetical protein
VARAGVLGADPVQECGDIGAYEGCLDRGGVAAATEMAGKVASRVRSEIMITTVGSSKSFLEVHRLS